MKIKIGIFLILCGSVSCSSVKDTGDRLPDVFISLKDPLESTRGQVALSCIRYWSDTYMRAEPALRFVPFSEQQIAQIRPKFSHSIAPGARAEVHYHGEYRKIRHVGKDRHPIDIIDRETGEEGIAVGIGAVEVFTNGEATVLLGTCNHFGLSTYEFKLTETNGNWRVISYTNTFDLDAFYYRQKELQLFSPEQREGVSPDIYIPVQFHIFRSCQGIADRILASWLHGKAAKLIPNLHNQVSLI